MLIEGDATCTTFVWAIARARYMHSTAPPQGRTAVQQADRISCSERRQLLLSLSMLHCVCHDMERQLQQPMQQPVRTTCILSNRLEECISVDMMMTAADKWKGWQHRAHSIYISVHHTCMLTHGVNSSRLHHIDRVGADSIVDMHDWVGSHHLPIYLELADI